MKRQQMSANGLYNRHYHDHGYQEDGYEQHQYAEIVWFAKAAVSKVVKGEQNKTSHQNVCFVGGGPCYVNTGDVRCQSTKKDTQFCVS